MPRTALPEGYSTRSLEVRPSYWDALKARSRSTGRALHALLEEAIVAAKRIRGRRKRVDRQGFRVVFIAMNDEIHAHLWDLKAGRGQRIYDTVDHALQHYLPEATHGGDDNEKGEQEQQHISK